MPRRLLLIPGAILLLAAALAARAGTDHPAGGRVVILGMDGFDARLAGRWMDSGDLPALAELRARGTFAPLMPANPAQSPVSWATLNTGRNPGKHAIFDFVRNQRTSRTILPGIGFQERTRRVGAAESGLLLAQPWVRYGALGAGLLLAAGAFFVLRSKRLAAGAAAVVFLGAAGYFYYLTADSFPRGGFTDYRSLVRAEPFWQELDAAGVSFRGQGVIVSYPVEPLEHGEVIAGLGAPDAKWGLNTFAIYTTLEQRKRGRSYTSQVAPDPAGPRGVIKKRGAGAVFRLVPDGQGRLASKLFGPKNLVAVEHLMRRKEEIRQAMENRTGDLVALREEKENIDDDLKNAAVTDTWVPLTVRWSPGDAAAEISVGGTSQSVQLGTWSSFFPVVFRWSPLLSTRALARFWAEADGDGLEVFSAPLQIDPDDTLPGTRICWPPTFAAKLRKEAGPYETLGWACQTHAVKDLELSDAAFLADIEFTYEWRMAQLRAAARDADWQVLFQFFGSPDRVCHMMMRHFDEKHPEYDEAAANREYNFFGRWVKAKDTVPAIYKKMDDTVRFVLDEVLRPEDTLMIVSDHGFDSFRREFSINNWLAEEGFLAWKQKDRYGNPSTKKSLAWPPFSYVDWSQTRAYSVAISKIYLNLRNREPFGMVSKEDAGSVVDEIIGRLLEYRDPETGEQVVVRAYKREDIYTGDWWKERRNSDPEKRADGAAELTLDLAPGYRSAWVTGAGGMNFDEVEDADGSRRAVPGKTVYDNTILWSGDHCGVDLSVVQGTFFSNRRMAPPAGDDHFDAEHLAPTVLALVGVPAPDDYDRAALQTSPGTR